jgi:hypothetical protein
MMKNTKPRLLTDVIIDNILDMNIEEGVKREMISKFDPMQGIKIELLIKQSRFK